LRGESAQVFFGADAHRWCGDYDFLGGIFVDVPVSFGTSGHRGIVGDSFTLAHVQAIAVGVSQWLRDSDAPLCVAIGYDSRDGNDPDRAPGSFTHILVETLLDYGVSVWFATAPTPTPVMSWVVTQYKLGGALILTASHNPPQYNGLKFNPPNGAPASVEVTSFIEQAANAHMATPTASRYSRGELSLRDDFPQVFSEGLHQTLSDFLGSFDLSQSRILVDAAHGAVAKTWEAVFTRFGIRENAILCAEPLKNFGGLEPNPTHAKAFGRLQSVIQEQQAWGRSWDMAIGNDPDGDRHIVLDDLGVPLTPEETSVLILEMLLAAGKLPYAVASTLASSALIRAACETHSIRYVETAVGFKYFASIFEEADAAGGFALGVESSGGFSISRHTYEKCGFLPLMLAHYIRGKPLSVLRQSLSRYGDFVFSETSFAFEPSKKSELIRFFAEVEAVDLTALMSVESLDKTIEIDRRDGLKVTLASGAWVLIRLSGTEPIGRIYAESTTVEETDRLIATVKKIIMGSKGR
jgi:phosphomannomutase